MTKSVADIIGARIVRVFEEYTRDEKLGLSQASYYFELEDGAVFSFGTNGTILEGRPTEAKVMDGDVLDNVVGLRIRAAYVYEPVEDAEPDDICLQMESGFWVHQVSCAFDGILVGLFVPPEQPGPDLKLVKAADF